MEQPKMSKTFSLSIRFNLVRNANPRRFGIECKVSLKNHWQEAEALFKPQNALKASGRRVARIPIDSITPNPDQPRKRIDPEGLKQLTESIRRYGQLTPILVRAEGGRYVLVAGQRRLKALKLLGRSHADAIVLDSGECDGALIALVENLQRESLHYLDEAEAIRRILDTHPITQERLAASLSISPSALANKLRLLKLPPEVREALRRGNLTERHARALARLDSPEDQLELARIASEQRLSVRQLDAAVAKKLKPRAPGPKVSRVVRDNRIIINAVMDTVRELNHIGVNVSSRVEECGDHIDVVVTIPVSGSGNS